MITGEGIAPSDSKDAAERYYKSGTTGPLFACAANAGLACAWGAVKAMLALGRVPPESRTPAMRAAVDEGVKFLLIYDPAVADYPAGYSGKPSSSWFKFGYPIGYVTDVLQNLEALASLGYAQDPRLAGALEGATHVTVAGPQGPQALTQRYPMEDVLEDKVFLAHHVNERPLHRKHGFPLRSVAEGYYGYDWIKYVSTLTVDKVPGA